MQYRRFTRQLEAVAQQWGDAVLTDDIWQDIGAFGSSESKPFRAKRERDGFIGLAKPGAKKNDGIARAAHEKIASDLAYHLELPVPPVILWDRGEVEGADPYVAISAWAFSPVFTWDEAKSRLTAEHWEEARFVYGGVAAFDAWIGAEDRKADHVLVNVSERGELQLAFIDYAYSLSKLWSSGRAPLNAPPDYLKLGVNRKAMRKIVSRIDGLADDVIRRVVRRVPKSFLSEENRCMIEEKLLMRKQALPGSLGVIAE